MNRMRVQRPVNMRLILLLCTAVTIPLLSHVIKDQVPWVRDFELKSYDHHIRELRRLPPDPRIVIVGMDDGSLDRLFRKGQIDRPAYSRKMQARLLHELHLAGTRIVAFDVYFTDPAPREETLALAAAMRESSNTIVALKSEDVPTSSAGEDQRRFTEPVPQLRPYTSYGSILFPPTAGHIIRWFAPWPVDSWTARRYLHFSVAAASQYFGEAKQEPVSLEKFRLGSIHAPFIDPDRNVAIRYIGPPYTFVPDPEQPYSTPPAHYIPYELAYSGDWKKRGTDFFRDKLVLVGRVSPQLDQVQTPVGDMPGVELEANAIQTLLQGSYLQTWSAGANYLVKVLLCLSLGLCVWRLNLFWAGLFGLFVSLAWWSITSRLFAAGIWADTVDPILALWLTYGAASAIEAWKIRDIFSRFVPSQIADDILRAPDAAATDREVAIIFCDVRNYTCLSENLPPDTVESLLHSHFLAGEAAADRFDGVLDKFIGDEMMLYFEHKSGRESHTLRAVRWALVMQRKAMEMNQSGIGGEIGFHIGIGISSGRVRFGRVKARQRLQHTVIGDAVNVASRLEGVCKEVHRGIVLSDAAYQQIENRIEAELIGSVSIKGKQEPVTVYFPIRVLD